MTLYRIILQDRLRLGRDRDEEFASLQEAEAFANTLPREGTTCVYQVRCYAEGGFRALAAVERYVVWNDTPRYAALEANLSGGRLNTIP